MDGLLVIERLEALLVKMQTDLNELESRVSDVKDARKKAIRKYEPERCCPNCDFVAGRGESFRVCKP